MNTHFDHIGIKARLESAKLILSILDDLLSENNYPVILMGDLNSEPDSEVVSMLKSVLMDSFESSSQSNYGVEYTFNGFNSSINSTRRIDFIMTDLPVKKIAIPDDKWNGKYPSDHFPVLVDILFK